MAHLAATSVSAPRGTSEFDYAKLTPVPGRLVTALRVGEVLAALECKVTQVFTPRTLPGTESESIVVVGQIVGVHIDESILREGRVDLTVARPVARLGYLDFTAVHETWAMRRPKWEPKL